MALDTKTKDIIDDIFKSVNIYGKRNAFVIKDKTYTYEYLRNRVYAIAYFLQKENADIIGVIVGNNIETYSAILAILAMGKTYVVLHPSYPDNRNATIVEEAEIEMILGTKENEREKNWCENVPFCNLSKLEGRDGNFLPVNEPRETAAYIIFTSGSTGVPKGVPISYSNLNAFYDSYSAINWNLDYADRMLQMFELTFDVSVVSTLYPLTLGACIYTVGFEDVKYLKVFDILERYELTFATVAPSLLQLIAPYFDEISLPNLKYLAVTAEASSVDTLERFRHCAPNAQFVNLYGPTEGTIYCTVYHIPSTGQVKQYNGMTAIGKPLKNVDIRLVDEKGNCVPIGEQGELWICGPQVMSGYWKDERKTATALFRDPSGKIFYKTNDICILDKDGDLLYCGRKDNQIKIQGFRVELSEIEYDAHQFFNKSHNAVAMALDREGCKEIHLAVDCTQEELEGLSNYLKEKLPSYMIPKQIHCLDSFPLNTNNKIDRKAIAEIIK